MAETTGGAITTGRHAGEPGRGVLPAPFGALGARVYSLEIGRRNRRYDRGVGVERLPLPVISVGNLSVGGTGKSPMVLHILRLLTDAGVRSCVAMRGYKAGTGESDEAEQYRREVPDVAVVARPDRATGVREALASAGGDGLGCVVLDDGFQHRKIARDTDIVLIDASRNPFEDALLPAGWLREPVESLARADAVVVTHAELADEEALSRLDREIERVHGKPPIARTRHAWSELSTSGQDEPLPVTWLAGKRVVASCAIGNPRGFLSALQTGVMAPMGGSIASSLVLRDHDPFKPATVERIVRAASVSEADAIVVTEKDWSKLASVPASTWPCPVIRPRLRLFFDWGLDELDAMALAAARPDAPEGEGA